MRHCTIARGWRTVALGLAAMGAAGAASGAELTLYEHAEFGGRSITLRGDASDMAGSRFNDRASSLVIRSGRWELCSSRDFRGDCATFGPGEYASIDRMNDRISSARQVGRDGDARGRGGGYGRRDDDRDDDRRADVVLFESKGMANERYRVRDDTDDLARTGFNDRAESMIVRNGAWELCSDAHFGGRCAVYRPGRYEDLGRMGRRVSSLRRIN